MQPVYQACTIQYAHPRELANNVYCLFGSVGGTTSVLFVGISLLPPCYTCVPPPLSFLLNLPIKDLESIFQKKIRRDVGGMYVCACVHY